ncbi:MAG: PaaX family transcriptional regulator C-terminal domain-containing protein [Aeromicrobium sp.]
MAPLPQLSARSVALSFLLGAPEGRLAVRDLLAMGEMCGVAPQTMRVALSRLVGAREVSASEGVYTLSPHHLERLRAQERDIAPRLTRWDGTWETVIVVESGRDATDRARLRADLTAARLAELREGVWMRPANLDRPRFRDPHTTALLTTPDHPEQILAALWDIDAWAKTGHDLLVAAAGPELNGRRLAAVAALVRQLRTDPALPDDLIPNDWPADAMRAAYAEYRSQLHAHHLRTEGALA